MSTLVLSILFNLSLYAQEAAPVIDYAATYECQGNHEYYVIENGIKSVPETESLKFKIIFNQKETYVTVYVSEEPFFEAIAFLPNYNACERVFESQNMSLHMHAVASNFNAVICKKDRLYASYFLAGLYGSSNAFVDMKATSAETVTFFNTDFDYQENGNFIIRNLNLSCKKKGP